MSYTQNASYYMDLDIIDFCRRTKYGNRPSRFFSFRFETISTPIFRHGPPSIDDIRQGGARDCIFLSLLSSFVYNTTNNYRRAQLWDWKEKFTTIENLIEDSPNFVYINDKSNGRRYRIRKVLPRGRNIRVSNYSRSRTWVRFLEIFLHMMHTSPDNKTFAPAPAQGFFKFCGFNVPEDESCVNIVPLKEMKSLDDYLKISPVAVARSATMHGNQEKFGIFSNHAYGVLDVNTQRRTVTLFNPLRKEPGFVGLFGFKEKSVCFTLNWEDFKKCQFSKIFSPKNDGFSHFHNVMDTDSLSSDGDDF